MAKFKIAFKGYDKAEVDAYLHKTKEYHESHVRDLEEAIKRLKEENDYLYAKNSEYHRNEEKVSNAIVKAMEIKGELEREIKKKIELEEDRLKIFKTKWLAYVRGINHANADRVLEDQQEYIESFKRDFTKKATSELNLPEGELSPAERSFLAEKERLAAIAKAEQEENKSAVTLTAKPTSDSAKSDNGFFED